METYTKAFWSRKEVVELIKGVGMTEEVGIKAYQSCKKDFLQHLIDHNFTNPGIRGVPSQMVKSFILRYYMVNLDSYYANKK